ncbi:hypothetical protein KAZ66_01810 [Candidatus Woesebacteria bacterium]|nr:hypothetical protein [Candidatus Woesebacteria bacterium]
MSDDNIPVVITIHTPSFIDFIQKNSDTYVFAIGKEQGQIAVTALEGSPLDCCFNLEEIDGKTHIYVECETPMKEIPPWLHHLLQDYKILLQTWRDTSAKIPEVELHFLYLPNN